MDSEQMQHRLALPLRGVHCSYSTCFCRPNHLVRVSHWYVIAQYSALREHAHYDYLIDGWLES